MAIGIFNELAFKQFVSFYKERTSPKYIAQ